MKLKLGGMFLLVFSLFTFGPSGKAFADNTNVAADEDLVALIANLDKVLDAQSGLDGTLDESNMELYRDDDDDDDDDDRFYPRRAYARCMAVKRIFGLRTQRFVASAYGRNHWQARRRACARAMQRCEFSRPYILGACTVVGRRW